jgi:hypothetical protein
LSGLLESTKNLIESPFLAGVVGVSGFLVSLVGFGLALWQISKVKAATVAANEAVSKSMSRLHRTSAIGEIKQCLAYVTSATQSLEAEDRSIAARNLDAAKLHIIRFNSFDASSFSTTVRSEEEYAALSKVVLEIADIVKKLRNVSPARVSRRFYLEVGTKVAEQHDFLVRFATSFELKE